MSPLLGSLCLPKRGEMIGINHHIFLYFPEPLGEDVEIPEWKQENRSELTGEHYA